MKITLGIGCDRGTPASTLHDALAQALALAQATPADVMAVASITLKADEPGLLAFAAQHGWAIHFYTPAQLAAVAVPNPSETVRRHTGTPSVSEAAALLAAGAAATASAAAGGAADATQLLVEKHKWRGADGRHATFSIARMPP